MSSSAPIHKENDETLSIDEIIAHCERTTERHEAYLEKCGQNERNITDKQYWEHRQVKKYLCELKQYRAIGTLEELQSAVNFKNYFMELYGEGLEVANWHKNGDLEPLTTFIDSALESVIENGDKAMVVVDIPKSCSKCKFMYEFYGVKKCQLLNILENGGKAIIPQETLTIGRKDCCPLKKMPEREVKTVEES